MKKLSQLQQEKTALEKRLDRYISKEVKASKAMKVGLIFKITSLEVKIEKLQKEENKMETFDLNNALTALFEIDFSNCEMSEDFEEEIRNIFSDEDILEISENLYVNGKVIDLSSYSNDYDVIDIVDRVAGIAYNIEKYELPMKERIAKKKAIEQQVRDEFHNGTRQFPKEYPILIRTESEEWTDGWATDTTYTYYYQMPDGSNFYDNKTHPTCDEHIIQRAIKAEIARQVK